ncbi:hypothetical protein [Hydrogenimonas thermophila]|uniref:Uncharacterized protein n=1 Tax=Hydrogenimonas thermophila TaxID=223786 RepID=A0A1I5PND6_9BACT|nr:hypothetical protein [Hydrogenimonas thermophila]WOE71113.1 hypothetical protein RZR91_05945 [Hydrogenimonas thermophila]WOE73631.1 hypothetical protein RZR97_05925 [Hydrogenimonas thermophila]SFP35041.1 hypothetical protein SAMN05216234_11618 [Hydrogenimonas thermophila]
MNLKCFIKAYFSGTVSLPKELNEYLNNYFFKDFSVFIYMPKTPFIWQISSGVNRGFESYIIIYKWSKDNLLRLRSIYFKKEKC